MFQRVLHQKVLSSVVEAGSAEPLLRVVPFLVSTWIEFWNFRIDILIVGSILYFAVLSNLLLKDFLYKIRFFRENLS
jgi:hypothetical protein